MPELPEVETVCRGLNVLLRGHRIISIQCNWFKSLPVSAEREAAHVLGAGFVRVHRRAKLVIIELDNGYCLVTHLKMTGQLVFIADSGQRFGAGHPSDSLVDNLPDRSTRVVFELDNARLFFNDQRKFGWMQLVPTADVSKMDFVRRLGPEPLEDSFTPQVFRDALQRRKGSCIKAALLDQTVLAGIGNIYADEALWAAQIHPETKVQGLSAKETELLWRELRAVLELSIREGGSSDRNYVNAEGKRGAYLNFAKVFRRQGKPCLRCGLLIQKIRVAGRGTHLCPGCQVRNER